MTKSRMAVPGLFEGHVRTVKMLGSMWSNDTEFTTQKWARLYLHGA